MKIKKLGENGNEANQETLEEEHERLYGLFKSMSLEEWQEKIPLDVRQRASRLRYCAYLAKKKGTTMGDEEAHLDEPSEFSKEFSERCKRIFKNTDAEEGYQGLPFMG